MGSLLAAIDQGTTSTRCMIFEPDGGVRGFAQAEHRQIYPRSGWVEHDPAELWSRTEEVVRGAMGEAGASAGDLAGVGITNQRETLVMWDRETGEPLCNAIVWQDTRTDGLCRSLAGDAGADRFRSVTGLPLATYFTAPKIRWAMEHAPGVREAVSRGRALAGTVDAWLVWNLTGEHRTDVTNASRMMLMDLRRLAWDAGVMEAVGVPGEVLPEITASIGAGVFGETRESGPFGGAAPVSCVLGDQQAALVGQGCFDEGSSKNTYGTGAFLLLNTGGEPVESASGLLTTVGYQRAGADAVYALEGSVAIAGALVQWLRDELGIIGSSSEVETLARRAEDSGGVVIVPAFSGLFAPRWRSDARGVICGLTRGSGRAELCRAALEAVCLQTRDVLDAMRADASCAPERLRVDGGMVQNNLLMQIQADVLGIPVVRPAISETTALGAAFGAGLAAGVFRDEEDVKRHWRAERTWEPRIGDAEREALLSRWRRGVERSLGWVDPHNGEG